MKNISTSVHQYISTSVHQYISKLFVTSKICLFLVLMLPSVMFAASSTQLDFKPKSVDADLGKCAFLITHAQALPNGYYKICAESLNLQNSGIWTLTSKGTTIYVSSSSEKSFCINTSVLQGIFTLTFEVDGQICFQSYNLPIVDTDCPLFPFGPMGICDSTVMLDSVFLEKTVGHPFVYKFNDGSAGVKTSNLDFELPDGATEICITYSLPGSERLTTCCYNIHINECCNTADFDFKIKEVEGIAISRSCLNPEYEIISHCINNDGFHKWEFEDGKVYYGAIPPTDYIFSNFLNLDYEVCITHTYICCGDTLVSTKCAPHDIGAWIGLPGETNYLSDLIHCKDIPSPITIKDFLYQYASDPLNPMFIDGNLEVDISSSFNGGVWYLGKEASITQNGQFLSLNNVIIQSAVRANRNACCTWLGIVAKNNARIIMNNCQVNDALIMLHYPNKSTAQKVPLRIQNCSFKGNVTGIKITDQPVNIQLFSGNSFDGKPGHICGCGVVNAFDFRTTGNNALAIKFPNAGTRNKIKGYEQGVHCENVSLEFYNFDIFDLSDFDPVTLDGWNPAWNNPSPADAQIGIDYAWNKAGNSSLKIDDLYFTTIDLINPKNIKIGVRERIKNGTHTLRADAAKVKGDIKMYDVNNGYAIEVSGLGRMKSSMIKDNIITTNGSLTSTGIDVGVSTKNNELKILNNRMYINGGLNAAHGVLLNSNSDLSQKFLVENNRMDVATTSNGNGIHVNNCKNTVVRSNNLKIDPYKEAMNFVNGGKSDIACNYINGGEIELFLQSSPDNRITENDFHLNFENNLKAQGGCMMDKGTLIAYNDFRYSDAGPGVLYEKTATVGSQLHEGYNFWTFQEGIEVAHKVGIITNSQFHYPFGAVKGSVHRPFSDPDGLMVHSPWVTSVPDKLCVETYVPEDPGNDQWYDNVSVSNRYAAIVSDTAYAASLTAAEYGHLRQSIYRVIKENPAWLSASVVLDDFYTEEQSSFIGQSIMISDSLEGFEYRIAQQQDILQPYQDSIQILQAEADLLNELLDITADSDSINMILTMLQNIDSSMKQLSHQAEVLSTAFQMYNDTTLGQIKTLNNSLSVLSDYEAWEKEMTKLKIKLLKDLAFTSSDTLLVREVASACYKDGGRAVYMARNISNSYLKEYYTDAGCGYAEIEERDSGSSSTTAVIWPNPASDKVSISLEESDAAQDAEVRIYNTFGRLVYVQGFDRNAKNKLEVSLNELTPGMYFVELKRGNHNTKAKLIVIH
ncbi:MAG: T9SS type A sorting domain-containing protein [Saprospiraceae bacterium]|nr:T9SS type A sorting domain-containing protein [Saprospiraceae bacterium]